MKKPERAVANGHPKTREEKVVMDNSNGVDAPKKSFALIVSPLYVLNPILWLNLA